MFADRSVLFAFVAVVALIFVAQKAQPAIEVARTVKKITTTIDELPSIATPAKSKAAADFIAFAQEYKLYAANYRLAEMNSRWDNKAITWEGRVSTVSESGTLLVMVPLDGSDVECTFVAQKTGVIPDPGKLIGSTIVLQGEVHDVNVLGVIVAPNK